MKRKVEIYIPAPLRPYVGNADRVQIEAETVGEAIRALVERYPQLKAQLLDDQGRVRRHVNVFLNERNVNELGGLEVQVRDNDRSWLYVAGWRKAL